MKKTVLEQIQEHIRALPIYVPGKPLRQAELESGLAMIKMASNENPFGPSPLAEEAARTAASEINLYPDNDAAELRYALAARHDLSPEQVFMADGSLGVLDIVARTLLGPGLNCITSERSFISYQIMTKATGAEIITVPMRDDTYDLPAIAATVNTKTRVVIVANPNNPTGTMVDAEETENFLRNVPDHVLVVLDEAYSDFAQYFAGQRGTAYSQSFKHVRAGRPNLIVLRTFSKAHGLAGLRVGYGCGHPELLQYLARVRNSFSVSVVAQAAALAAIQDEEHIRMTVENNTVESSRMMDYFKTLEIRAIPTSANFIYFETEENADALAKQMQAEGIIIRSLVPWGIPRGVRVTIGTHEQNERFFEALKKIMSQAPALARIGRSVIG
ncbi:MAG TPA: histidinol-phosphate transaminase [Candidatus Angelobacter sp.]|jgi:histidinol-phosphate aminotransferase|nr:histidinol-phosphate transaminase [Candidatus Angelobacter sp.]